MERTSCPRALLQFWWLHFVCPLTRWLYRIRLDVLYCIVCWHGIWRWSWKMMKRYEKHWKAGLYSYTLSRFKTSLIETHTKVCEWGAQVNVRVCEWGVRVNVRVCEWGVRVHVRVCEWGVRVNVLVCEWLYECLPVPVHFHMFIFKAIYFEEYRLRSAHVQI